ncbi:MAG TPA: peptidoglycan editing factor PgeF [Burkholderiaceae bacterium]|jgi:hypothetical protein|nr:peptidoglycan editing factor PgeF [Burkholderiaceae bacterium]
MELIVPDWPGAPRNVAALSTTRRGGVSSAPYDDGSGAGGLNLGIHVGDQPDDVRRNRMLLRGVLPSEPVWLSQVHGTAVVDAAAATGIPRADACIAAAPGVVCAIQTADCLPVLFCDSGGKVVGAAHAGWRGLAHGVLENTVQAMRDRGAGEILAWLGPAIGPERFEVGEDVFAAFTANDGILRAGFRPIAGTPGKYLADIYFLARKKLERLDVRRCYGGGFCTVADRRRFYSYRRDRDTGRMASLIWLT